MDVMLAQHGKSCAGVVQWCSGGVGKSVMPSPKDANAKFRGQDFWQVKTDAGRDLASKNTSSNSNNYTWRMPAHSRVAHVVSISHLFDRFHYRSPRRSVNMQQQQTSWYDMWT